MLKFRLLLLLSLLRKSDGVTSGPMNVVSCPSEVGKRKVLTPILEFNPIANPPIAGSEKKLFSGANAGLKLRLILSPSRKYADCKPVWAFIEDSARIPPARIAMYFFIVLKFYVRLALDPGFDVQHSYTLGRVERGAEKVAAWSIGLDQQPDSIHPGNVSVA